ncbi:hypothetical protein [Sinorhizobium americanum]|uniref:hypothetical protein n=1 Tax=Sinorhizobium americanum TaxID=194963 RepID=UPI001F46C94F|nr:hypothetical protein [Sinorhizobium americanum]
MALEEIPHLISWFVTHLGVAMEASPGIEPECSLCSSRRWIAAPQAKFRRPAKNIPRPGKDEIVSAAVGMLSCNDPAVLSRDQCSEGDEQSAQA